MTMGVGHHPYHELLKGGPCRVAPQEILICHNIGSGQMNPKINVLDL